MHVIWLKNRVLCTVLAAPVGPAVSMMLVIFDAVSGDGSKSTERNLLQHQFSDPLTHPLVNDGLVDRPAITEQTQQYT